MKKCTIHSRQGALSLLARVSPNGGPSLEDLALLDSSDSDNWVLLVAIPSGDDVFLYRWSCEKGSR